MEEVPKENWDPPPCSSPELAPPSCHTVPGASPGCWIWRSLIQASKEGSSDPPTPERGCAALSPSIPAVLGPPRPLALLLLSCCHSGWHGGP